MEGKVLLCHPEYDPWSLNSSRPSTQQCHFHTNLIWCDGTFDASLYSYPKRSKTEWGSEGPGPLSWRAHRMFAGEGGFWYNVFRQWNQNVSFPFMTYSALLNNAFKALNRFSIIFYTYCMLHKFSYTWYKCFMPAACVDSSLQLSISAKTVWTASHFKLPSQYKTSTSTPLLHLSLARCQSGSLI